MAAFLGPGKPGPRGMRDAAVCTRLERVSLRGVADGHEEELEAVAQKAPQLSLS